MESEIFGHVKGAFTGAIADRNGAAAAADGGTLFLDEICEMDPYLQAKLLRFLQSVTFTRLGTEKQQKVDVRIVCATNRDPWAEVEAGRFREDLLYRLYVLPIEVPPCASVARMSFGSQKPYLQVKLQKKVRQPVSLVLTLALSCNPILGLVTFVSCKMLCDSPWLCTTNPSSRRLCYPLGFRRSQAFHQ